MVADHYNALAKTDANYVPLSPLSFLRRTADVFPEREAVIYQDRRHTWADVAERTQRSSCGMVNLIISLVSCIRLILLQYRLR